MPRKNKIPADFSEIGSDDGNAAISTAEPEPDGHAPGVVSRLLLRLADGDLDVYDQLTTIYFDRLRIFARPILNRSSVRYKDEADAAQSTMFNFVDAHRRGMYQDVRNRKNFEAIVFSMLKNRLKDYIKNELRLKRGNGTGVNLSAISFQQQNQFSDEKQTEEYFENQIDELLESIPDDRTRQVARLRIYGFTVNEIADELNVSVRTVFRELKTAEAELAEFQFP